jgi:hypothetical protein
MILIVGFFCRKDFHLAARRTAMGRTPAPRRRVALLSISSGRRSRRSREVLFGKQDLPKSATASDLYERLEVCGMNVATVIESLGKCTPSISYLGIPFSRYSKKSSHADS